MDEPFPLGLPTPTAFYLTIYLATLMIHIVFMNYVLAGSAYLAAATVVRGESSDKSPLVDMLRDWMPFMLSAAITAGIAPLLFLQILYKQQFYTANLLLFYRWMAILPVLVAGFYLSYLLKAKMVRRWPMPGRMLVGCGAFACFAFVGWSWVENHLLSVQGEEVWARQFQSETILFRSPELLPRLTLWFVAAFPTMALMVGWQLFRKAQADDHKSAATVPGSRRTSLVAMGGILLSVIAAAIYFYVMQQATRDTILGPVARPYLVLTIVGGVIQAVAWVPQYFQSRLSRRWLTVATVGLVVNFIGMAVVNEATRLATLDIESLFHLHEQAWKVSGLACFLVFLVLNVGLMSYCLRLVRLGTTNERR